MSKGAPKGMPKVDHPYAFSVSTIDTADLCLRKWAFGKIDRLYPPGSDAAQLGDRVHDVLEKYLKKGVPIDTDTLEGQLAMSAVEAKLLPEPKTPHMTVEEWFVYEYGSAVYRGKKDYNIRRPGQLPIIGDHKTTGDFRWLKTRDQLLSHVQSGLYAAQEMKETGAEAVELEWNYMRTKGAKRARGQRVQISYEQAMAIMEKTEQTAQKMIAVIQAKKADPKGFSAMSIPPNPSGCSAFGGCPFRVGSKAPEEFHRCDLTPKEVMRAMMSQAKAGSDWLTKLKDRRKKSGESNQTTEEQKQKDRDLVAKGKSNVNPPEREKVRKPPPPAAKKVGEDYIQAEWDDVKFEWVWPDEVKKAQEKKAAKSKPKEEKEGGEKKMSILERRRRKKELEAAAAAKEAAEEAPADPEEEAEESVPEEAPEAAAEAQEEAAAEAQEEAAAEAQEEAAEAPEEVPAAPAADKKSDISQIILENGGVIAMFLDQAIEFLATKVAEKLEQRKK